MEEAQNQSQGFSQGTPQPGEDRVSFPTVGSDKKNGGAKTLLIIGILILVGILGYVIYKSASGNNEDTALTEPTSYENMAAPDENPVPTETPIPESSLTAEDREDVTIQVQNGTGVSGEAAYLKDILEDMGYSEVATSNSASQDATSTKVSFSSSVSAAVKSEIIAKLNSLYKSVSETSSTSSSYDVVVITGLKKGATAKPSASPSASPTPTATPED